MAKAKLNVAIIEENIVDKIHLIRGQKVMIDRDLAELYGVETRRFKRAGKQKFKPLPQPLYV